MARKPPASSKRAAFAALLAGHVLGGTRPATPMGEPWTYAAFAGEIPGARDNQYASASSVSNWCSGRSLPAEIGPILRALFGPDTSTRHTEAREELRRAFQAARAELIAGAKPDPAGPNWVVSGDQLVIDRGVRPSDRDAAGDPVRQQFQTEIARLAGLIALQTLHLDNTQVSDVAPLAGLMALRLLHLNDTAVRDVSALDRLVDLEIVGGPAPREPRPKPPRRRSPTRK